jgi:hypothetical protein
MEEYNHFRPHSSLDNLTPAEVVGKHQLRVVKETRAISLPAAFLREGMYFLMQLGYVLPLQNA